jgi:HPt (histidine-containing phosphotransfer) domain-containing protein
MPVLPILHGVPPACIEHLLEAGAASSRFLTTREPGELERSADAWERTFAVPGFAEAPRDVQAEYYRRAIEVVEAAYHYGHRQQRLRQLAELEGSAARCETEGSDERLGWLNRRARHLLELSEQTGEPAHIERAIETYREAVAGVPRGSLTWRILASNLASALRDRYEASDDPAPLDEALALARASVEGGPIEDGYAAQMWHNLSLVLLCRYRVSRDSAERAALAQAVQSFAQSAARAGSAEYQARARQLEQQLEQDPGTASDPVLRWHADGYRRLLRYDETGDALALDRAIASLRRGGATRSLGGAEPPVRALRARRGPG